MSRFRAVSILRADASTQKPICRRRDTLDHRRDNSHDERQVEKSDLGDNVSMFLVASGKRRAVMVDHYDLKHTVAHINNEYSSRIGRMRC